MRQKGLVDLFVMKLDLKNYFLGQFLKQLTLKPSDLVFLCNLDTHVKFRAAMANKAIFGTLGETTRLMITMLATVVFGCQSDGPLKSCLKSTSDPLEVVNNCQFLADALSEISAKNKDESAGHPDSAGEKKQGDSQKVDDDDDGIETSLNDLVTPEELEADDSGKLEVWLDFLKNKFDSFVTLVIDQDTVGDLKSVVEKCEILQKVEGPAMLLFDSKIAGEASSNPNCRLPPFQGKMLRRYVQTFTALRGNGGDTEVQEGDLRRTDMIAYMDGSRPGNDSSVNGCLVDTNGRSMNKVKQNFTLVYDEESLGDRKEKVRGFVQQTENLNVFTLDGLQLQKQSRKHYSGTNLGSNIGPIRALGYDDPACWRLSLADKKLLYSEKGKILTGGACFLAHDGVQLLAPAFFPASLLVYQCIHEITELKKCMK